MLMQNWGLSILNALNNAVASGLPNLQQINLYSFL